MADVSISGLSEGIPSKNSAVIPYSDGSNTYRTAASGIVAASPGALLQTKFFHFTGTNSTTSSSYQNMYGLEITPISVNSKILISASVLVCAESWNSGPHFIGLRRGDTELTYQRANNFAGGAGDTNNNTFNVSLQFLDSPSTTSILSYYVSAKTISPGWTIAINKQIGNGVQLGYSTITAMEIAG
jgi:hypothetical protein